MTIRVKAYANLREFLGKESSTEVPEEPTLGALLDRLCERTSGLREKLFDDSGEIRRYFIVLVNGRNINFLSKLGTPVKDGDVISIFPPAAGG